MPLPLQGTSLNELLPFENARILSCDSFLPVPRYFPRNVFFHVFKEAAATRLEQVMYHDNTQETSQAVQQLTHRGTDQKHTTERTQHLRIRCIMRQEREWTASIPMPHTKRTKRQHLPTTTSNDDIHSAIMKKETDISHIKNITKPTRDKRGITRTSSAA
ncbi:hypothetical protein PROFUN_01676 [Planoprotostelium fungivorum]|uniref:Uncharacterized protein n=1 Tax=Planoprotostelium fungivorum TaxID=1890364 RepID=A0A2P6MW66_9EUKA|nr:hypothetical protein PROFUN_01676 [Planoprotostelium fungivorum]